MSYVPDNPDKRNLVNPINAVSLRVKASHPDHRAIFRGIAWVSLFVVLAKLVGAAKEMAVAYQYGVSANVDAYLFVFNFISWPVGVWFTVLTVLLVPLAVRIQREAPEELPRFRAELLAHTLLWCGGVAILSLIAMSIMLHTAWSGLPVDTVSIAEHMLPPMVALGPVGILISLFSAWTLAAGRHANTLLEGMPSLVIVTMLLLIPTRDVDLLVWATVVGFFVQMLLLAYPLVKRAEMERPLFSMRSPYWQTFWQGFGILLAGQGLMTLIGFIDVYYAGGLGTGAVSILGYANRVLALLLGLGATVASRAMLPVFSRASAKGDEECWLIVRQWACILFFLGVLAFAIGWYVAPFAVKILFERGAFLAADTEAVTEVLRYGLSQFPFYFSGLVLVTYASSRRQYKLLFWPGVIGIAAKVSANHLLIPVLGINGIAVGWSFVYALTALFFWISFRRMK